MFVPNNSVEAILNYYQAELSFLYSSSEIRHITAIVFEHLMGWKGSSVWLKRDQRLSESELLNFHFTLKRLVKGEPVQYVTGSAHFYGLVFDVNPYVLIPRPETEELVEWIVKETKPSARILDIGTGSGCIPIALKTAIPDCELTGIDISSEAIEVAHLNAKKNKVSVSFHCADVMKKEFSTIVGGNWDVIVSNPPYIPLYEIQDMHDNVKNYEPHLALFVSENDPLIFYKRIAEIAQRLLIDTGKIYFEISHKKGEEVVRLLQSMGFNNCVIKKDMQGNDRMVSAVK
jgi:release factor glutamine methyltransferase